MLPSRKILVGVSALITSTILEYLIGEQTQSAVKSASNIGIDASETSDQLLEQVHSQMGTSFIGHTICLVLMLAGMIMLIIGTYQAARLTEHIAKRIDTPSS